jgi:hypothetical protein
MTPEEKHIRVQFLWGKVRKYFKSQIFLNRAMGAVDEKHGDELGG